MAARYCARCQGGFLLLQLVLMQIEVQCVDPVKILALKESVEEVFGVSDSWVWGADSRDDLIECIIDAVFSVRMHHGQVDRLISRYRRWLREYSHESLVPQQVLELLSSAADSEAQSFQRIFPANKINGRPKTDIVAELCHEFSRCGYETKSDFVHAYQLRPHFMRDVWLRIYGLGQSSWCHFRLLVGAEKPCLNPKIIALLTAAGIEQCDKRKASFDTMVDAANEVIAELAFLFGTRPVMVEYALNQMTYASVKSSVTPAEDAA